MIEGLLKNQAVQLDEDMFLVKLHDGYSQSAFTFPIWNGTPVRIDVGKDPVILTTIEGIKQVILKPAEVIRYDHPTKDSLTVEERNQIFYSNNQYWDEDLEEFNWTLDEEYEYKKRLEELKEYSKVKSEPEEELVDVDIQLVGSAMDTGSKFIHTAINLGRVNFKGRVGAFKVEDTKISLDEWGKLSAEHCDKDLSKPEHSKLEFVKIAGKYVFGSRSTLDYVKTPNSVSFHTTLESAQNREEKIRNEVRSVVMLDILDKKLDALSVKVLVGELSRIRDFVTKLNVKVKSDQDKYNTLKSVSKLIDNLTEYGAGNKEEI